MARVGLRSAMFNEIDTTTNKYKELEGNKVPKLERIIDEKFAPEYNSAELYADDVLAESDYSFKKGTLTITVADDDDDIEMQFMGYAMSNGENTPIVKSVNSKGKEFGYGHIVTKLVNGVKKFKVEFFPRVRWTKITTDGKTKGEGVEFGTTTIEGVVMPLEKPFMFSILKENDFAGNVGDWEVHHTYDTLLEAEALLISLLTPTVVLPTNE